MLYLSDSLKPFSSSHLALSDTVRSCRYLSMSYLTVVPRRRVSPRGSSLIVNELESESQMCCVSSLCFDVTTTRSATANIKGNKKTFAEPLRRRKFLIRTKEGGVEANTKLSDEIVHLRRARFVHLRKEFARSRLGDRSQILRQMFPRHSNTSISYMQHVVFSVSLKINAILNWLPVSMHAHAHDNKIQKYARMVFNLKWIFFDRFMKYSWHNVTKIIHRIFKLLLHLNFASKRRRSKRYSFTCMLF